MRNCLRIFLAIIVTVQATAAWAEDWKHGDALFGKLKYEKGFDAYDHVNPDAPKGGRLNKAALGGYDSLNPFIVRGRAAAGLTYVGGLLWDTLFDQSIDQPSASYGLIAEAFNYPEDFSSATFRLNPKARWHDGKPITPEDVIWLLEKLRENQPLYTDYYKNVEKAEKTGEREVTFTFNIKGNRELPNIMGDLPVLPKHWWEGMDANGNKRNIAEPILEPPLGSGPYRIKSFKPGDSITYERVKDYWAENLGTRRGRYNFDEIRYVYFKDQSALWEAFKKGGIEDLWRETTSRRWATEYTFPAVKKGDVVRKAFPKEGSEFFQAFYFNTRNEKFKNPKLREAISLLFDFETMNKNLFFNLYTRTDSFFEGGELQSSGLPEGRELEILNEYKGRIPERIFSEVFKLPVIKTASDKRKVQRRALKLLKEAGYVFKNGKLLDPDGKEFTIEFLGNDPTDERITNPYIEELRLLGIKASLRIVDAAQYEARVESFDYEMKIFTTIQSLSPGNEQREYWTSGVVNKKGSRNYAGISDPVIDELVERIVVAKDRDELISLTRALDRILLWGFYAVPQWYKPEEWYAWWRKIQLPETQPKNVGIDRWSAWVDQEAAKELAQ